MIHHAVWLRNWYTFFIFIFKLIVLQPRMMREISFYYTMKFGNFEDPVKMFTTN